MAETQAPSKSKPETNYLMGKELVDFVAANGATMTQVQLAKAAGYVRQAKNGKMHTLKQLFLRNWLAAKGEKLGAGRASGNTARFITTVHANGIALVGKTYIDQFGLEPGDKLRIQLDDDCIRLYPAPADADADAQEDEAAELAAAA